MGGVPGASGPLWRGSSDTCFNRPAIRESMRPYGHIRGGARHLGGIMAATLAFWIYEGAAHPQHQGRRTPKWNLSVQVGLDMEAGPWQVAQSQHPSARAAGQAAPCPGLIQLTQDQLCQTPHPHSPCHSSGPAGPQAVGWHSASNVGVSGLSGVYMCDPQLRCDMQPYPDH